MARKDQPLWQCRNCGRGFANRNQSHACGRHDLARHFDGKAPLVRQIFDGFVRLFEVCGPVTILPEKTRIAFQVRMSFAQLTVRRHWVIGHFVLMRRAEDPLFMKIESLTPRNHVHHFRLDRLDQLDERMTAYALEAYAVGCQHHLAGNNMPHPTSRT